MSKKELACATVQDLMAMEEDGLLSPESQELVRDHLARWR